MKLRHIVLNSITAILLVFSCTSLSWSSTERLPQFVAARVATAPIMDGKLDDPVWSNAQEVTGFTLLSDSKILPRVATYARAVTDGKDLYLGFRCAEPHVAEIETRIQPRDSDVWTQESIEMMIDPAGDGKTFYHLIANISGGQYDSRITTNPKGAPDEDGKWNGDWELKTSRGDKVWYAEVKIPFFAIGADVIKNPILRINLSRSCRAERVEYSAWSPITISFNEPANMGTLVIPNADASYCRIDFPKLSSICVGAQDVPLSITNRSDVSIKPRLSYTLSGTQTVDGSVDLESIAADGTLSAVLPVKIDKPGNYTLNVCAVDSITGKALYSLTRTTEATLPIAFDEALYALYQKRADATIDIRVPYTGAKLKVYLLKDGSETPVATKTFKALSNRTVKVSFNLAHKSQGTYRMRAELVRAGNIVVSSHSRLFPYTPNPKIGFDKQGVMILEGKPFFPIGIYSLRSRNGTPEDKVAETVEKIMVEAKDAKFNSTVLYDDTAKDLMPLLDACDRHGIKAFVYPTMAFHKRKGEVTPDALHKEIDLRKNHHAVIGWYVADEPEGIGLALPQTVREEYQAIKEYDPDHPCMVVNMTAPAVSEYKSAADVMWVDPYPQPTLPITLVSDVVSGAVRNIEKDKPLWCVPQAFDWDGFKNIKLKKPHRPTPDEERCMTYMALVNGAKGIIYWVHTAGYYYIQDYPEFWVSVKKLAGELQDLSPILVKPTIEHKLSVSQKGKAIQSMLKRVKGQWYVFAVNSSNDPMVATFGIPDVADGSKLDVLFEGRTLSVENAGWKDSFKPLEAHVYKVAVQ